MIYEFGKGVKKDYSEAIKWYSKAAELGYTDAQTILEKTYKNGERGVIKDYVRAYMWYSIAYLKGYKDAEYYLKKLRYSMSEEQITEAELMAEKWYRNKAEQGLAYAQFSLGMMYYNGEGIEQDYAQALKWFRKADIQRHFIALKWIRKLAGKEFTDAQYYLGVKYEKCIEVGKISRNAIKWYSKAAEQGHIQAQFNLGMMYYLGQGEWQDKVESYNWFTIAAVNGNEYSKNRLDELKTSMTAAQITEAERRAEDWLSKHQNIPLY